MISKVSLAAFTSCVSFWASEWPCPQQVSSGTGFKSFPYRDSIALSRMGIMPPWMWDEMGQWFEIDKVLCKLSYCNYHPTLLLFKSSDQETENWNSRWKEGQSGKSELLRKRREHQPNLEITKFIGTYELWANQELNFSPESDLEPSHEPGGKQMVTGSPCFGVRSTWVPKAQVLDRLQDTGRCVSDRAKTKKEKRKLAIFVWKQLFFLF